MSDRPERSVALVGIGCVLPGGVRNPGDARRLFLEGRDVVGPIPPERFVLPATTRTGKPVPAEGALVDEVDRFDAELFGVSAREAASMDPQQRLLLEVAWAALEDAGLAPDRREGTRTGTYVGLGLTDWERRTFGSGVAERLDAWSGTGTFDSVAAGRIAYTFGLRGPALAVHTACSSSLVAVHLAIRALRSGEVDVALAGGVHLDLAPEPTLYFAELGALSPTGRCRTFDAAADGYVRGEGVGLFALMRLSDALGQGLRIHAVIDGSAVNQDGRTNGLTAPSQRAQVDVVREALADAGRDAAEVGFVEAHGTGTPLGDPVEVEALAAVFGAGDRPLHVSSGKTVLGHLESAAGVAGILRAWAALSTGRLPPHLHLRTPNPRLPVVGTRLRLGGSGPFAPSVAGVSGFGLSGTNAHLVLSRAPEEPSPPRAWPVLIALSARTEDALAERVAQVRTAEDVGAVARGHTEGRAALRWRSFGVLHAPDGGAGDWPVARSPGRAPGLVFVCPGQGSQLEGAGRSLAERFPAFRVALDEVESAWRAETGTSLVSAMFDGEALGATGWTQPAVFAYGWALCALLASAGVRPDAFVGHSVGELLAATAAGAMPLREGVRLLAARARLLDALPAGGRMVALRADESTVRAALTGEVELAAVNAPDEVVLAGASAAVEATLARLPGVKATALPVSHAFHSPLVDAAVAPFARAIGDARYPAPVVPVFSALDGALLAASDAARWARHVRAPVRFADAVSAAVEAGFERFVELGARRVLGGAIVRTAPDAIVHGASADPAGVLALLGELFVAGVAVDLEAVGRGPRDTVPVYPFARVRHWLEPVGAPPVVSADFTRRRVPVDGPGPGSATAFRDPVEAAFAMGAAATDPSGPVAAVDPACPEDLAHPGLPEEVDEVWIDATGQVTTEVLVDAPVALHPRPLEPEAPILVLGGTGHLGRAVLRAFAARGARRFEVWSRRPPTAPAPPGCTLTHRSVDLADPASWPSVEGFQGAVHAAGEVFVDPVRARAVKAGVLAHLDRGLRRPGAFLVAVGSVAGHWGSPGLGLYGAANRAMEAVIARRVADGLAGATVVLGPVAGGGLVSAGELEAFARAGVEPVGAERAAEVIAAAVDHRGPILGVGRVDWARLVPVAERRGRRRLFDEVRPPVPRAASRAPERERVLEATAALLGRSARDLDPDQGFFALGLDSVLAVELVRTLARRLGRPVPDTAVFEHPTPAALAAWLGGAAAGAPVAPVEAGEPIAIVGHACRFPGGADAAAFWSLLVSDGDAVGPVPPDRWASEDWPEAPTEGGFLADLAGFDGAPFGIGAAEAAVMDPQQRLLLEVTWEALEHAVLAPDRLEGVRGSVHVGIGRSEYWDRVREPEREGYVFTGVGNESSFAAGRLAHLLGLRGEALAVNTACSSSLVALHLACRALRAREADVALAGGVNVLASPEAGTVLARMGALSPTNRCRTFDASADGYVRGEGCGMLVLKRLSDARRDGDRVHATILGSSVGHDGRSPGLAVPSGAAQQQVVRQALADAGVSAADVDVVAAHGTGTPLGDPVEVGALAAVHGDRDRPLLLSALKSRIGHLEAAAGVASVVSLVLAMAHRTVPGNGHFTVPNPRLPAGPFRFPVAPEPWPARSGRPLRAGVSAFGLSGTDAHLILGEGDPAPPVAGDAPLRLVSAATAEAAEVLARRVAAATGPGLGAVGWHGRAHLPFRVAWTVGAPVPEPVRVRPGVRIGFLCPGQGAQAPALGQVLRAAGVGAELERLVEPFPPLREVLFADDDRVDDTRWTQPVMVVVALALGRWLERRGVHPVAVAGHSVGELAAAALAGRLTDAEAVAFAVARGALVGGAPRDGGMVALRAPEAVARGLLVPGVSIAATNADDETVISGFAAPLQGVVARATAAGIEARPLHTSHAFHGPPMDPLCERLRPLVPADRPGTDVAFVSALPGSSPADPEHWVRHLREPVAFAAALRTLAPVVDVLVELGPRAVLCGLGARTLPDVAFVPALRTVEPTEPWACAAALWARGAPVDLSEAVGPRVVVDAPTTPFLRSRAWVDLPRAAVAPMPVLRVSWGPGTPGTAPAAVTAVPVASVADLLALARRGFGEGCTVLRADGVFEGTDPERAAIGGAFASLCEEYADRDLRLFDGVPDGRLPEALALGSSRVRAVDGALLVPSLVPAEAGPPLPVRDTWLVSGGDGALGRRVVAWLRAHGARDVVVLSRSTGVDVADRAAVEAAVARVRARGDRLGGVFHAVGVARGVLARDEDEAGLRAVWAAKVDGARHLSDAVGPAPFVVASSAISWLGLAGHVAYGAANAAAEALVRARRARGWPASALAFGPFTEGMAGAVDWAGRGVEPVAPERGAAVLARLPDGVVFPLVRAKAQEPPAVPAPVTGPGPLLALVREVTAAVLGRGEVAPDTGFADAGADSLAAVEIARRLAGRLGRKLPATLLFERPTPRVLAAWLAHGAPAPTPTAAPAEEDGIAIVGMACRFPSADSPEALWDLLAGGRIAIGPVPSDRWDADALYTPFPGAPGRSYVREGGFLADPKGFDPEAFGLSPREATSLDPQQRLLLEVSREALERAGHAGPDLAGSRTSVFVGIADRGFLHRFQRPGEPLYPDAWAGTGTEPSFAAGRLAFVFGLRGEAIALNTTCSSSLVAVHHAVRALRGGECDRALAGGVAMQFLADDTAYLCALQALSPTHRCHTFDARADGYVRSEGCGMFVLTRLADARARGDRVLGVIRGSAVNHDGASSGLTVPNGAAQEAVLRAALADAGVSPGDVGYLETHGTGTRLGDPIETRAIAAVYGDRGAAAPLVLGAVKANLGHTELAAGAASLAKLLLVLEHGAVPPQPGLGSLNPELGLAGAVVARDPMTFPAAVRFAAVSAFGLSGTNAHLVIERPDPPAEVPLAEAPPAVVLAVSASSEAAVRAYGTAVDALSAPAAEVAAVLAARAPRRWRAAVVAGAGALAAAPVRAAKAEPVVAFLSSGQGSQRAGMGLAFDARSPTFRASLDACAGVLDPLLGRPLRTLLADPEAVDRTEYTQPLLFAVSWATARWLQRCGVTPAVVAGHSLGELVAATLAGVWDLPDALRLVVARGEGMAARALPGAMAAVALPGGELARWLAPGAEVAAFNAPDESVVAGPVEAVEATLARLPSGTRVTRLAVSRPFHSACVDPMLDGFEAAVAAVPASAPTVRVVSLATGALASEALRAPRFWREHARNPVRCGEAAAALSALGCDAFVDLGPTPVLSSLVRRNLPGNAAPFLATARRDADPWSTFAATLADLFTLGVDVDFTGLDEAPRRRVAVPTTPFDRRPFWLPEPAPSAAPAPAFVVEWHPAAERAPLPPQVRLEGPPGPWATALGAAGIAVVADAPVTVDLRFLGARLSADALRHFRDVRGERWVILLNDDEADPDAAAFRAAARSVRLERPGTRLDLVHVHGPGDLVVGLSTGLDEVAVRHGAPAAPRLVPFVPSPAGFDWSGRWLVTGGLGALGLQLAAFLAARGATELVLVSRAPQPDDPRLAALPCPVHVEAADVADEAAVRDLLDRWPVDGVVHAAGVTLPQPLDALDDETVARTLSGKVGGARVLDAVLADRPLRAFLLVGSIAGVWGSRDLVTYAAANAFLDGLARRRRSQGRVAQCVAFGPWGGGGMVDPDRAARLARAGLALLEPRGALSTVGALAGGPGSVVVVRADWGRLAPSLEGGGPQGLFRALVPPVSAPPAPVAPSAEPLEAQVARHVKGVLGWAPERVLAADLPLADLGFDSLMATELKARLLADGVDLPLGRILSGPSVAELVEMAAARRAPEPVASPASPASEGPDRVLWWTHLAAVIVGIAVASAVWALAGR